LTAGGALGNLPQTKVVQLIKLIYLFTYSSKIDNLIDLVLI
jgi:hypothetical protein